MRAHATACALTLGLLARATVAAPVPSQSLLPLEFSPLPLGEYRRQMGEPAHVTAIKNREVVQMQANGGP